VIGRLRGVIVHKQPPWLLLEVGGVGYELEAPMSTFYELPGVGEPATLLTHLAVREDAHVLYGFAREAERSLFRSLLKVNGVGAKMALAILSGMNAEAFAQCVRAEDLAALTRLPGIGRKTAERLVVEMRDRLGEPGVEPARRMAPAVSGAAAPSASGEAAAALESLGYRPQDAARMVRVVDAEGLTSEELIRAALQGAAKR